MSKFAEALKAGKFVVIAGVPSPRGVNLDSFRQRVRSLKDRLEAVVISDGRGATLALSPLAAALVAREAGAEVILTLNCRDRNRLALAAELLGASALGLSDILLVSGDYLHFGDAPAAKPVFDLDSVQALQLARTLQSGQDLSGQDLDGRPAFFLGAVANPEAQPLGPQLIKTWKKIQAQADFLVTLDTYEVGRLEAFMKELGHSEIKVIAGVRLLGPADIARQKTANHPGNLIPDAVLAQFEGLEEGPALELGKRLAAELIRELRAKNLVHGLYLHADFHPEMVPEALTAAGR